MQLNFFVNAIDTETKGLDFVITQNSRISNVKIDNNFAINLNKTKKSNSHFRFITISRFRKVYFAENVRVYLEEATPRVKATLSHNISWKDFSFYLRNTYYGKVTSPDLIDVNGDGTIGAQEHQSIADKVITDVSAALSIYKM